MRFSKKYYFLISLIILAFVFWPYPGLATVKKVPFGGTITFFGFVPFCGLVITVGPPQPIMAIYTWQKYLYNPPLPVPPNPPIQKAIGIATIFNPNIFCPLPIVMIMGISPPIPLP